MIESLKAVKYIDSDHFAVPEGKRGVELVAGKESALSQVVFTIPNRVYVLSFSVGDANNSCEGSMVVEAFAGLDTIKVPYESKGKGGFKRAKLRFKAISKRTRVMFLSTYYTTKNDNSGSLCGPVLDDVKLLSVRKARVWSGWLWYYSIDYPPTLLLGIHLMYFDVIEIEALISLHLILYHVPIPINFSCRMGDISLHRAFIRTNPMDDGSFRNCRMLACNNTIFWVPYHMVTLVVCCHLFIKR